MTTHYAKYNPYKGKSVPICSTDIKTHKEVPEGTKYEECTADKEKVNCPFCEQVLLRLSRVVRTKKTKHVHLFKGGKYKKKGK